MNARQWSFRTRQVPQPMGGAGARGSGQSGTFVENVDPTRRHISREACTRCNRRPKHLDSAKTDPRAAVFFRSLQTCLALMAGIVLSTDVPLPVEQACVVAVYPHNRDGFTEGLLIRNGVLYESTGEVGRSFIRSTNLTTGQPMRIVAIPHDLFGEGLADWGPRLYSITWHGGRGFVWDADTLRFLGRWHYGGEGWGMTRDKRYVVMSDGSPVLRFLRPGYMDVVRRVRVTALGQPVSKLNELEFVHGEILANIFETARIARIDPVSGNIKGWIDLSRLWNRVGRADSQAVPNGIAYDAATDRLYVTGKNWPLLFEISRSERCRTD